MDKPNRPTCRSCGKPLRLFRWRAMEWAKERGLWWGDYGEGLFCGLRCGYRYACKLTGRKPGPC